MHIFEVKANTHNPQKNAQAHDTVWFSYFEMWANREAFATPVRNSRTRMRYCSCSRSGYDIPRTKWLLFLFLATQFYRRRPLSQIIRNCHYIYAYLYMRAPYRMLLPIYHALCQNAERSQNCWYIRKMESDEPFHVEHNTEHTSGIWSLRRYTLALECVIAGFDRFWICLITRMCICNLFNQ